MRNRSPWAAGLFVAMVAFFGGNAVADQSDGGAALFHDQIAAATSAAPADPRADGSVRSGAEIYGAMLFHVPADTASDVADNAR